MQKYPIKTRIFFSSTVFTAVMKKVSNLLHWVVNSTPSIASFLCFLIKYFGRFLMSTVALISE